LLFLSLCFLIFYFNVGINGALSFTFDIVTSLGSELNIAKQTEKARKEEGRNITSRREEKKKKKSKHADNKAKAVSLHAAKELRGEEVYE
jgi:hypothetical protein